MRLAFESIVEKTNSIGRFLTGRSIVKPDKKKFEAGHLNYLDGLRAVAALYVLLHHAVLQVNISSSNSRVVNWLYAIFEHGRFAVDLFIVISGFCLMLPVIQNDGVLKKGALSFFARRAKRILPTYYLAMGLSMILIYTVIGKKTGTNWDISIPVTNLDIITHLLLIQDILYETVFKINHVFWSISVEWHIYFLFPVLVMMWRKSGAIATCMISLLLSLFFWFVLPRIGLNVYGMAPHYIALFSFGMLAAQISFSTLKAWKILIVIFFALLVAWVHPIVRNDFLVGLSSACLLIGVSMHKLPKLRSFLSWRPLAFTGTFAYSIYLVHAPLLQLFSQYVIDKFQLSPLLSIVFFFVICAPLIVGFSYLFFLVAERPFLSYRKKILPGNTRELEKTKLPAKKPIKNPPINV